MASFGLSRLVARAGPGANAFWWSGNRITPLGLLDWSLFSARRMEFVCRALAVSRRASPETAQPKWTLLSVLNVGAVIDRPPKNNVFRIFRRKITHLSSCGDGFSAKIHGRPMVAPTQKNRPIWGGFDQFSVPRTSARELSLRKVSRLYRYSTSVMLWLEIRFSRSP